MSLRPTTHHQRGAALLTAMIIVTLVATLAAAMVWQQWRAVQIEVAERARLQSAWILSGALDWAKLILREDGKAGGADHLGEPWAVPLAEARLSTFLAADKNNTDDGPEAFLSGSIIDVQSRFNLRRLIDNENKVSKGQVEALQQLFKAIEVEPGLAERIAIGLRDAIAPPANSGEGPQNVPLLPRSVWQLGWLGVDADSIQRMAPYVTLLPVPTPINVNTAPAEVLMAAIPGLDRGTAQRIVEHRQRSPFKATQDMLSLLPAALQSQPFSPNDLHTTSSFFEVRGRLRLDDRVLEESSLVERQPSSNVVITLWRQRENSRESSQ
jgi:general secretion pathway protein K